MASYRSENRRRPIALALTVAAHLLLVWLLFHLAPTVPPRVEERDPVSFSLYPSDSAVKNPSKRTVTRKPRPSGGAPKRAETPPTRTPPTTPVPPPPETPWLYGDRSLFASGDISRIRSAPANDGAGAGSGTGADSGSAYGPGEGPGGARLYNAEWYVEPADSQLSPYLPHNIDRGSWGMVACRTIPNYGVENCRTLGESPLGSGIARGIRLAAWQFKVRPPRIDGKPIIGAWVKIRIDFTEAGASVRR